MTDKPRFHVIDGTAPPDTPAEQVRRRVPAEWGEGGTDMINKPRITKTTTGWSCVGLGHEGSSRTPRGAYNDWLNEVGFYPYF